MKIVITDYPKVLERDLLYEKNRIISKLPQAEIAVVTYTDRADWLNKVKDADAILTAFIPIDESVMNAMPNLKCIILNASGFDNVDSDAAKSKGISIIPIEEYCTQEVAEHTLALLFALSKGLKHYTIDIEEKHIWQYSTLKGIHQIYGQTMGIAGFGKIGKRVGKMAHMMGMKILVYSPTGKTTNTEDYPVEFVDKEGLLTRSNVISNHMAIGKDHYQFFDENAFSKMRLQPLFINVGRGAAVDEKALIKALDCNWIKGAGLDVLSTEKPDMENCALLGRENVIITPHSAFYSEESLKALQDISCDNLIHFFKGEIDQIHKII